MLIRKLYAGADPETGALAPEYLAKIYLWLGAAKARAITLIERTEIARIETMVLTVMPSAWRADLDKKVAGHLAKY